MDWTYLFGHDWSDGIDTYPSGSQFESQATHPVLKGGFAHCVEGHGRTCLMPIGASAMFINIELFLRPQEEDSHNAKTSRERLEP
jgi:hypothetical protein